jgi:dTDP-4-amino-4,6-dideoxygalactose transaminase
MDPILAVAKRHKLKVIEDTAQAIGATYKGRKAGSMGDLGALSFFPSKNLGGFGDAGMVVTGDRALADRIRMLRVHGSAERYMHSEVGMNSRLDNLQAAVLRVKLRHLDGWLEARRSNAAYYNAKLKGLPIICPYVPEHNVHTYHLYVVRLRERMAKLRDFLNENGVEARTYYPVALHEQQCYRSLGYKKGDLKESEKAALQTLSFAAYPELEKEEKDYVAGKIREFFEKRP